MTAFSILRHSAFLAGCVAIAFVAFATLSPIELRPHAAGAGLEHVAAFSVISILFGVAFPRHWLAVAVLIALAAGSLEAAQLLVPGRHGRWIDLGQKLLGVGAGLAVAATFEMLLQRCFGEVASRSPGRRDRRVASRL